MSITKVTKQSVTFVCTCGAYTEYTYTDLEVTDGAVVFPKCNVCNVYSASAICAPYDRSWTALTDDQIMQKVVNQVAHKWATEHPDTRKPKEMSRADFLEFCKQQELHLLVDDSISTYRATPVQGKLKAIEEFERTGKPVVQPQDVPDHLKEKPEKTEHFHLVKDLAQGKIHKMPVEEEAKEEESE